MLRFDDAPKRPANFSLNAKVLDMAKELGMNISQTVDQLLAEEVRRRYREAWLARNQEAIVEYNTRIEKEGAFGARYRTFMRTPEEG